MVGRYNKKRGVKGERKQKFHSKMRVQGKRGGPENTRKEDDPEMRGGTKQLFSDGGSQRTLWNNKRWRRKEKHLYRSKQRKYGTLGHRGRGTHSVG